MIVNDKENILIRLHSLKVKLLDRTWNQNMVSHSFSLSLTSHFKQSQNSELINLERLVLAWMPEVCHGCLAPTEFKKITSGTCKCWGTLGFWTDSTHSFKFLTKALSVIGWNICKLKLSLYWLSSRLSCESTILSIVKVLSSFTAEFSH